MAQFTANSIKLGLRVNDPKNYSPSSTSAVDEFKKEKSLGQTGNQTRCCGKEQARSQSRSNIKEKVEVDRTHLKETH